MDDTLQTFNTSAIRQEDFFFLCKEKGLGCQEGEHDAKRTEIDWKREYEEYQKAMDVFAKARAAILDGKSCYIAGSAGTGKSTFLESIRVDLNRECRRYVFTAPTGMAASGIGGSTVHSFAGLGIPAENDTPQDVIERFKTRKDVLRRWRETEYLFIDEISMLAPYYFDILDGFARFARGVPDRPFGGITVVAIGDFFQLPPVRKDKRKRSNVDPAPNGRYYRSPADAFYCFELAVWDELFTHAFRFTYMFRQKDRRFAELLERIRFMRHTREDMQLIRDRMVPMENIGNAPVVFARKFNIDDINAKRLNQLGTETKFFEAEVTFTGFNDKRKGEAVAMRFEEQCGIKLHMQLRVGAIVTLVKQFDQRKVSNGAVGEIVRFEDNAPVIRFKMTTRRIVPQEWKIEDKLENTTVVIKQLPLRLAYAFTVHKMQGQTLERGAVSLGEDLFAPGHAYTALSRFTTLDDVMVVNFSPRAFFSDPEVIRYHNFVFGEKNTGGRWPDENDLRQAMQRFLSRQQTKRAKIE